MAAPILKNLTFFVFKHASTKNNAHACISSICLRFLSTQTLDMNPTVYEILVHKHDFPSEFASQVASKLTGAKNPETADSTLSFLKASGFSIPQLQRILNYSPRFLLCSLIKPKIKTFQDEGFSPDDLSNVISRDPKILDMSLKNNIVPSLSMLKELLGSNAEVVRVVRKSPRLMSLNMRRTLAPNVEFLKSCGVSGDRIRLMLYAGSPRALVCKPEAMRAFVDKTREMGIDATSKAFIYAVQTIGSLRSGGWELKLQAFRDMGFSVLSMFRRDPGVLGVSVAKAKKVTELLLSTGKFGMSSIVDYPAALKYSAEMRYGPRVRVLEVLERENLIQKWPNLRTLCHLPDAKFYDLFVRPYLDHLSDVLRPQSLSLEE